LFHPLIWEKKDWFVMGRSWLANPNNDFSSNGFGKEHEDDEAIQEA
jgi:hypothetical protein